MRGRKRRARSRSWTLLVGLEGLGPWRRVSLPCAMRRRLQGGSAICGDGSREAEGVAGLGGGREYAHGAGAKSGPRLRLGCGAQARVGGLARGLRWMAVAGEWVVMW